MSTYTNRFLYDQEDFIYNSETRCPVLLLLDRSGSMQGKPIDELNSGLAEFKADILKDGLASKRVEICVGTFGGSVDFTERFRSVGDWTPPTLTAGGDTPMARAIREGLTHLRDRKDAVRKAGVMMYRPWVFLITDGEPTEDWHDVPRLLESEVEKRAFLFHAVGVQGANMSVLKQLSPSSVPLKLKELRFRDLFLWLSSSLQRVSSSGPGEQLTLENPAAPQGWGTIEI